MATKILNPQVLERRRIAILALLVSAIILAVKFIAYRLTHSTAVLTDAAESIINLIAGAFALYSIVLSARPADEKHPYGHGKVEYFAAGFEGAFIIIASLLMLGRALKAIMVPSEIHQLDLGMLLVGIGGAANGILGRYLVRCGRANNSIVIEANGKHIFSDAYTSVGVVLGLAAVKFTGIHLFDPLLASVLALQILLTGFRLVNQSFGGLMDAASPALLERLTKTLSKIRQDFMIDLHYLRCRRVGDSYHIDFHLIVPRFWDIDKSHIKVHEIEDLLFDDLAEQGEVIVHTEPCKPEWCNSCKVEPCPVRGDKFKEQIAWSTSSLVQGPHRSRQLDRP
jgi:cation diffusion facilitator family transporter